MNPQALNLKAKIKIHKSTTPIRPVINNIYAPTHKIAQHIHHKLKDLVKLRYEHNITNTIQFAENVTKLKLNSEHKLLTMDIMDLYVKIPINHTLSIVNKLLKNNRIDEGIIRELMFTLRMITNQNYFQYEGKFYKPNLGVAMGSPLSGILAKIFLQDLEQHRIKHLLEGGIIICYNRYVDGIFIIYNQTKITPHTLTKHFNAQHKDLQFTINEELNNQITYLDLNLTNRQ
jgi:hypothetical protein